MSAVLSDPDMWTALFKIAVINVVLSGDNAVVIALACRSLEPKQQRNAFLVGAVGIIVLLTALTAGAALLMQLPYIQWIGGALLLWIGVKLLLPESDADEVGSTAKFWTAVRTIIVADLVMSIDNVLGMAGAAHGHFAMLFLGLAITMPLILFGSAMLMRLMRRFPVVITIGAGLLGYVAGDMVVGDQVVRGWVETTAPSLDVVVPILGALIVIAIGKLLARRQSRDTAPEAATAANRAEVEAQAAS